MGQAPRDKYPVSAGQVRPADVGRRVTIRRVFTDPIIDPTPGTAKDPTTPAGRTGAVGDVLGTLLRYDDELAIVRTRRGDVSIPVGDVIASRVVR